MMVVTDRLVWRDYLLLPLSTQQHLLIPHTHFHCQTQKLHTFHHNPRAARYVTTPPATLHHLHRVQLEPLQEAQKRRRDVWSPWRVRWVVNILMNCECPQRENLQIQRLQRIAEQACVNQKKNMTSMLRGPQMDLIVPEDRGASMREAKKKATAMWLASRWI